MTRKPDESFLRSISWRQGAVIIGVVAALTVAGLAIADPQPQRTQAFHRGSVVPGSGHRSHVVRGGRRSGSAATVTTVTAPAPPPRPRIVGVSSTISTFRDPSRVMHLPTGQVVPRVVKTIVLYPRVSGGATGVRALAPFPLIVFGHGFAVSPEPYMRLLTKWARAGYVVAAPIFPLENADAPGGPDEHDLVNQPGDMTLVITDMERVSAWEGPLSGLIDPRHIAVAGQSDGGDTALATAYDPMVRDRRVTAAVILSGAEDPFARPFAMPTRGPALLAVQGTADTINPPGETYAFFASAGRPKYLLQLIGSGHQPPYTDPGPVLGEVERASLAFLDAYLKHDTWRLQALVTAGSAGPATKLTSDP